MRIEPYTGEVKREWDHFVTECQNCTFLHTRQFLSYHGDRFRDRSIVVTKDKGGWLAALPAAEDPHDTKRIVSHPGITYGGIVHKGDLHGFEMIEALKSTADYYRGQGYASWLYKPVPYIYHRPPSFDDIYGMFRLNAKKLHCDLSETVDLCARRPVSGRRRRGEKKAHAAGVVVERGPHLIDEFWGVLQANLWERYSRRPVHTVDEIRLLSEQFPKEIEFVGGLLEGRVVAGTVIFHSKNVAHAQYIAASIEGKQCSALDAVFENCIQDATRRKKRYFDFGVSTEKGGEHLNDGLHQFKYEFGAGTTMYEAYEIVL